MDRRLHRSNGSVAHTSLRGSCAAKRFIDGVLQTVSVPVANLLQEPSGSMDRQLIFGDRFNVLETRGGYSFGFAEACGYVGYIQTDALEIGQVATHRVCSFGAQIYPRRSIKAVPVKIIPFHSSLTCSEQKEGFWKTPFGFIPEQQISSRTDFQTDIATTALRFLGVPYLWGGDSNYGLDCSGLVHIALSVAGEPCPRDSDQQETFFNALPQGMALQRNDLVFWKGHVGIMVDPENIVHANGHHMCVTVENLTLVRNRILETEGTQVSKFARPVINLPRG